MSTHFNYEEDQPSGPLDSVVSLPGPEAFIEENVPDKHPAVTKSSAGWLGATARTIQGIPPNVWVANGSRIPITVVVHKFKPNIQMTGGGFNVGADGAGVTAEGEIWYPPSTKKELLSNQEAVFPLWSRKNGYGSISIYRGTGASKLLYIANDRVGAGQQATFEDVPDLYIVDFKGNEVTNPRD